MTIKDFEDVLHSDCLNKWFNSNIDNLIGGVKGTTHFVREDEITKAIVNCLGNINIVTQVKPESKRGKLDIHDKINNDIAEAAHNGTFNGQSPLDGPNHIVTDFFKRKVLGLKGDFYALMYLLDIENIDPSSLFTYGVPVNRQTALQKKYKVENYLNKLPGKIQVHEPFHNLKSPTETTIVNYDIYVLKMKFDKKTANDIYNNFKNDLDYFKKGIFDKSHLI